MNDEFERTETNEEDYYSNEDKPGSFSYSYRSEDEQDTRWEPDSDKYNTKTPEPPKKKKSHWWIPVAVVMTVIVAAVVVGALVGFGMIKRAVTNVSESAPIVQQAEAPEEVTNAAENGSSGLIINEAEDVNLADAQTAGVYLTDVSDVVSEVMPAVVSITSRTLVSNGGYGGFFYYYGNQSSGSQTEEVESGIGSGTIVGQNEKELLILTSYHVVEGSSSLYVTFCDDAAVDGSIKAVSEEDDIAIVSVPLDQISDDTLSAIRMAALAEGQPEVGDGAIVIGNALGYGQSVVTGIVSALDRQITVEGKTVTVIQTDAAINSGNSGGCLLNSKGEIIGISEAKITSSQVEGMCYAISVNYYYDKIMDMLGQEPLDDYGSNNGSTDNQTAASQGAYLGVYGYDIGKDLADSYGIPEGVYVISTVEGSGAEEAGVEEGDVIVGIDGKDISSMSELQRALSEYEPGDKVSLTVMRENGDEYEKIEVTVTLSASL